MGLSPSDFLGTWKLQRVIDDVARHQKVHFSGEAGIRAENEDFVYSEKGILDLPNAAPMHAERRYIWRPTGHGFDVYFADKRFFHTFDLHVEGNASHWCDPDQYEVTYDVSQWPRWHSTWTVVGPRKNYVMISHYNIAS